MAHNTLGLPPKFCRDYCFQIPLGGLHTPKTIVYAKLGGGGANKVQMCLDQQEKTKKSHLINF